MSRSFMLAAAALLALAPAAIPSAAMAQQSGGTTSGTAAPGGANTNGDYNRSVQGNVNGNGGHAGDKGVAGAESGKAPSTNGAGSSSKSE